MADHSSFNYFAQFEEANPGPVGASIQRLSRDLELPAALVRSQLSKAFCAPAEISLTAHSGRLRSRRLKLCLLAATTLGALLMYGRRKTPHKDVLYDTVANERKDVRDLYYRPIMDAMPQLLHQDLPARVSSAYPWDMRFASFRLKVRVTAGAVRALFDSLAGNDTEKSLSLQIYFVGALTALQASAHFRGRKAKVIVSAADVYWGGITYAIAKRETGAHIVLLQQFIAHGGRNRDDYGRCADHYFVLNSAQPSLMPYSYFGEHHVVGDVSLMAKTRRYSQASDIDVAFVEAFPNDIPGLCSAAAFLQLATSLSQISRENPNLRIAYLPRPRRDDFGQRGLVAKSRMAQLDEIISRGAFIIDAREPSLAIVARSKVVVVHSSTMWMDALGMGKRILVLNSERAPSLPNDETSVCVIRQADPVTVKASIDATLSLSEAEAERFRDAHVVRHEDPFVPVKKLIGSLLAHWPA